MRFLSFLFSNVVSMKWSKNICDYSASSFLTMDFVFHSGD